MINHDLIKQYQELYREQFQMEINEIYAEAEILRIIGLFKLIGFNPQDYINHKKESGIITDSIRSKNNHSMKSTINPHSTHASNSQ